MIDDTRLPDEIEQGSTGGPQFYTSVLSLANGKEARNQNWQDAKCVYDISYGVTAETFKLVIAFFRARRGRARGFRFKDWSDFEGFGEQLAGPTNGVNRVFQLVKTYDDTITSFVRKITRPVPGTLTVYGNGGAIRYDYTLGPLGVITFDTAPINDGVVTADFEFDVPVRFDNDTLGLSMENFNAVAVGSITLKELSE